MVTTVSFFLCFVWGGEGGGEGYSCNCLLMYYYTDVDYYYIVAEELKIK